MFLAQSRFALGLASALAAMLLAASNATAQLKIAYAPQGEASNLQMIALRPNTVQPVFIRYFNPGPGSRKNVKVTLEQFDGDKWKEIAKTTILKVGVKEEAPVKFDGIPTPKAPAPWPSLAGPPFMLRFSVDDGTGKEVKTEVAVKLQEPREYVKVREARYDPERRRLSFKLSSNEPLDPPCPVELTLLPSAIPGLLPNSAGTFKQKLSKENQVVELSADNVEFEGGVPPQNGRVYLNVDGFERAFLYKCAFADGSLTPLKDEMRARIVAPRYSKPQAKIPVTIEVDVRGQSDGDDDPLQRSYIDLRFDRSGQGNYEKTPGSPYRGLRDQSVEYMAEGDALVFKTKVKDRVVELDTEGINGKRTLKVRVLSKPDVPAPIADEQDSTVEKVSLFSAGDSNRFAPLVFDRTNDSVLAELILDSTPAEDLRLSNVPAKTKPEEKISPRLQVKPRLRGVQAPIEKVYFFFGEADKEHKIPEKAAKFEAFLDKDKFYVLKEDMVVPAEHRGKLFVSAQVETATGVLMSKKEPTTVRSADAKDGDADVLTTISGKVARGELVQKDVTVFLSKAKPEKGDVPKQAKSNEEGKYSFADVKPGDYIVSARKLDTVAREVISIAPGTEKLEVNLKLTVR